MGCDGDQAKLLERYNELDTCATLRSALDPELSTQHIRSLLHIRYSQMFVLMGRFLKFLHVKSYPVVFDNEAEATWGELNHDPDHRGLAVLSRVGHRFLRYPKYRYPLAHR